MSPTLEPIHRLAQGVRVHGPALLSGMPEPHDELMSLVWGRALTASMRWAW